jgi:hypothetical protein
VFSLMFNPFPSTSRLSLSHISTCDTWFLGRADVVAF